MIDQLVEKYLTGFKQYGHLVDIWKDPIKKELAEMHGKWRFIADARTKSVYVWSAMGALHADAYKVVKQDHDPNMAMIYKHPSILPGTYDDGVVTIYAADYMSQAIRKGIKEQDWSFLEKFFDDKGKKFFEDALVRL